MKALLYNSLIGRVMKLLTTLRSKRILPPHHNKNHINPEFIFSTTLTCDSLINLKLHTHDVAINKRNKSHLVVVFKKGRMVYS